MTAQQPPRLLRGIPLVVRNLQKTFGARQVLRDIDLHIPAGNSSPWSGVVVAAKYFAALARRPRSTDWR